MGGPSQPCIDQSKIQNNELHIYTLFDILNSLKIYKMKRGG